MPTFSREKILKILRRDRFLVQQVLMFQRLMEGIRSGMVSAHQMIKLSDESLYRSKNSGRDKCGPVRVVKA